MSHCSSRALTLLSSVFGACGLLLVGIAVSTDYWLYMEEGTVLPQNQTTEVKMALHAGLWRVCFFAGREKGRCVASEYFLEPEINLVTENTENILKTVRTATPFPMVSLFLVFTAFVISNIGHIRPQRTILAFVSGIFFILSGLSLVVGLVLYISSINDEVMNRPSSSEQYFHYRYGWSFAFAASSFLLKEVIKEHPHSHNFISNFQSFTDTLKTRIPRMCDFESWSQDLPSAMRSLPSPPPHLYRQADKHWNISTSP
ncbi:af288387_1calcium channel gamma subunit 7 [Lynx pardinus]|uniref:Voltage-dependent calcium channel gamma-7 subunit n=1 Tax=Lynx pardinus TaxID=191816 RepID=A0A485NUC4_LYNPA|nr:af288387_1calcium channel gamma subunit 7 [Lynx pardinus]